MIERIKRGSHDTTHYEGNRFAMWTQDSFNEAFDDVWPAYEPKQTGYIGIIWRSDGDALFDTIDRLCTFGKPERIYVVDAQGMDDMYRAFTTSDHPDADGCAKFLILMKAKAAYYRTADGSNRTVH